MSEGFNAAAREMEILDLRKENSKLRAAISFWRMARYPEIRPEPHDIEGRCQVQAALDMAENTLYSLASHTSNCGAD